MRTAPDISQTVASQHAARIDNTPEPTLVPNELATSFAPMPNANTNAITKPIIKIHKTSGEYGSIAEEMRTFLVHDANQITKDNSKIESKLTTQPNTTKL